MADSLIRDKASERRSRARVFKALSFLAAGVLSLLIASPGIAQQQAEQIHSGSVLAQGIDVYYAIVPAEILRGYPGGSVESTMHGGVPGGAHEHHLMVALFDTAMNNERISDARVTATVAEVGLAGQQKPLQSMAEDGFVTYGNYFGGFYPNTTYRVTVDIALPGHAAPVEAQFDFNHD